MRKFVNILNDKKAFSLGGRPFLAAEGFAGHVGACYARLLTGKDLLCFRLRHQCNAVLSNIPKKPAKQTRRVLRPRQKAAKGGKGEGEGKESPERKTVGRGKGGKCRLLYQFCLFPSLHFPEGCPLWQYRP